MFKNITKEHTAQRWWIFCMAFCDVPVGGVSNFDTAEEASSNEISSG